MTRPWTYNPRLGAVIDDLVASEVADGWLFKRQLSPARRAACLQTVFFDGQPRWRSAFVVMLLLGAGVGTLGLSQDNAATVIGSMVIAPLGQPIVALGAAVAMAWIREVGRLVAVIVVGSAAVVAVSALLGTLLPDATPNSQILARTAPDLRDLGVAMFAGAAGAFAYTRDELSGALPGVAIAVALVPPLATFGLMLEETRTTLAKGAGTLFVTNMVGITAAAAAVMLLTGFVSMPRLKRRSPSIVAGLTLVLIATVAVSIPLGRTYAAVAEQSRIATELHAATGDAISGSGTTIKGIDVRDGNVSVTVADPTAVDRAQVESAVRSVVGPGATVTVSGG